MIGMMKTWVKQCRAEDPATYAKAKNMMAVTEIVVLSYGAEAFEVLLERKGQEWEIALFKNYDSLTWYLNGKYAEPNEDMMMVAMYLVAEADKYGNHHVAEGRAYSRQGMKKRVLEERLTRAVQAKYRIKWADNLYGEHLLTNDKGKTYRITLRDFDSETGYINNPDWRFNKLGTTKHIMFAFEQLRKQPALRKKLKKKFPFVEIYTDPLNDYRITWYYPHEMPANIDTLIRKHFGNKQHLEGDAVKKFLPFLKAAADMPLIKIRPEVEEMVNDAWEQEMMQNLQKKTKLDYSALKVKPFPYQQQGIEFATFRSGAIIADEMGLGKTLQAIATAIFKKELFGFSKALVVCPASLKAQWKAEIEKYSSEKAVIADGFPKERALLYKNSSSYFVIVNYETVLRDWKAMNNASFDLVILDEAQRIKNFGTTTAQTVKMLQKKHCLVITGTPIENKLADLYSVMQFVNPALLGPLWEFSYQHCYFDVRKADKITGYYNLQNLNAKLKEVLIRRSKREVLRDLPNLTQKDVPVLLSSEQASYHASYAQALSKLLRKKVLTPYDMQKMQLLLTSMRMVCDSTFLVDKETNTSPKLTELRYLLTEQMSLPESGRKVLIFSEWVTMLDLIGNMLNELGITYVKMTGEVPVKHRQKLVEQFTNDPVCTVFLSSEAGGAGLNLQVADTVINFELPWNPGKKNQRIGRIDRLGQRSKHLTVINFITRLSIEERIAQGLVLKQSLFEGVLHADNKINAVDFSSKGRSQFLEQLEKFMDDFAAPVQEAEPQQWEEPAQTADAPEMDLSPFAEGDADLRENAEQEAEEAVPVYEQQEASQPGAPEMMKEVLSSGMQFLSGLFKMATGKEMPVDNNSIEFDANTGEVVMRFKMK